MMPSETEFRLSDSSFLGIANVVVLNYVQLFIFFVVTFVANADKHENVFGGFPHCVHGDLLFCHVVLNSHLLRESVNIVLSVGVISKIISLEHPLLIVPSFKPANHWVWVTFFGDVLMSPFIILCLIDIEWFIIRSWRVIIIRQFVSIIIVSAKLLNAEIFSISKGLYFSLIRFFVEEVMRSSSELMFFQVQNSDAVSSRLNHDGFSFAQHTESIHWLFEDMLK
jgi:hypothetical protein